MFDVYNSATIFRTAQNDTKAINTLLDNWHKAAANADFDMYFDAIAEDGYFIGTDATEKWDKAAFVAYAKPHFNKGKAWTFTPVQRDIYFSKDGKVAWFDELLDTRMKICRGSGVLEKQKGDWKIKHYVLSMTVPNQASKEVIPLKAHYEDALIEKLHKAKQ
ncbi:nuclear transport factor 2 family protein [Flavobacterium rhizosphaerae]|uniref:Nuclear transport factor 2 family protein n=1 Tax=Flavobacterium rhizosphaerae TaxID=3163298 RepID=A0ABW8YXG7_9FLAO